MCNHPNEVTVQRYAASALKNFCSDVGTNTILLNLFSRIFIDFFQDNNKLVTVREGGIGALLQAMAKFSSETELLVNAASALQNIAANNGSVGSNF